MDRLWKTVTGGPWGTGLAGCENVEGKRCKMQEKSSHASPALEREGGLDLPSRLPVSSARDESPLETRGNGDQSESPRLGASSAAPPFRGLEHVTWPL